MTSPKAHKRALLLRSLIERFDPSGLSSLASYLPPRLRQAVETAPSSPLEPTEVPSAGAFLRQIHYSWLAQPIQAAPTPLRQLYLSALGAPDKLAGYLHETPHPGHLSQPIRQLLLTQLAAQFGPDPVIPIERLPPDPLNRLLMLSKPKLVHLIAILGLRDLAHEMRRTVDRETLSTIYELLSPLETEFVKNCMREPEPLPQPEVGLSAWKENRHTLQTRAQQQGLLRLGHALAHQERSLLWHLAHRLDKGRGRLLIGHARETISQKQAARLAEQVLNLLDYLGSASSEEASV